MQEDKWVPTVCGMCYSHCGILVHSVNGVVVKIEGNPDCHNSQGRICSKGLSGMMLLYDPNRLNFPLKRTNPRKGIGVDPGWARITWEEALQTITDRLAKIKREDPRKLMIGTSVINMDQASMLRLFAAAFGTPNGFSSSGGVHCGNAEHLFGGLMHAAWSKQPDFEYCNYLLNFGGVPAGTGAYYCGSGMAQDFSNARVRGMKHVVIDPMLNLAGEKADEWIPIRPGTDGALALALLNLLLNELNIYDSEYLKDHTNAPYLIKEDGYYLRDSASNKPVVWDAADSRAKTYDDPSIRDPVLAGEFTVDGASIKTAFSLLKKHVEKYVPDLASEITGIPANIIRRIAGEFGRAARIGSTIVLDGKELPYRPVAVLYFRGAQGHRNATLTSMAIELLAEIVGASNVPGGILGMNARSLGYPGSGKPFYTPSEGPDGLLKIGTWLSAGIPYPPAEARKPTLYGLTDLIPTAVVNSPLNPLVILEPEKFKMPYKIEFLLTVGGNYFMTMADPNLLARAYRNIFSVSFRLFLDETSEFADIVLPDASYLERLSFGIDSVASNNPAKEWGFRVRQPVVEPLFERRDSQEVLLDLARRMGIEKILYKVMKAPAGYLMPFTLDKSDSYSSLEEIVDKRYKSLFGEEHGLEWFKKNGVLKWPKKVEEVYWKPFVKARAPIYFEFFKNVGEQVRKITGENGIVGIDTSSFQPLPDWKPCASHEEKRDGFDFYAIYFRVAMQTFSSTYNNPWLDEASKIDPYAYNIAMNSEAARKKGIKDGDWVTLDSAGTGNKVKGRVRLTEAVHPEVVAIANCGGHWAKNLPLASMEGKGACFSWLLPLSFDYLDIPVLNQDLCVKVKVSRI